MLAPLRLFFFYIAAPPVFLAVIIFLATDNFPQNPDRVALNDQDINRAKQILHPSINPHSPIQTIHHNEADLNVAINYLLNLLLKSSSKVTLSKDALNFDITLALPENPFGKYLNLSFDLSKNDALPIIKALKIGRLTIADEFAGLIIEGVINNTPLKQYYILAAHHISGISIQPDKLSISYFSDFEEAAKTPQLENNPQYQSMVFYQQEINKIARQHDPKWLLSLSKIMQVLFTHAYERSDANNAIAENRALIIALSSYVNQQELQHYLAINFDNSHYYPVYLYRRKDMAKHFVTSAALAAAGATLLADMIGQEKELFDAKRGSGFSFIDLAGDRAGLRFGQIATASPESARRLQEIIKETKDYRVFMPEVRDMPERMNSHVFKTLYGSIYSQRYQNMLKMIDDRINALEIYQTQ